MRQIENTNKQPRHPIQVVATRTGLSKDVIRIWERRYSAITPGRSDTGRRLFSDADIDRLLKLKKLTAAGWRIGEIATMPAEDLDALTAEQTQFPVNSAPKRAESVTEESYLSRCFSAVEAMNPWELESLLSAASVAMSIPKLLDDLMAPLLVRIGNRWHKGELRVGQEHMASSVIRAFLDRLRESANMVTDGPVILVTTPSGQNHEMGAQMVAVAAANVGWKSIYLTPNLPARDIAASAETLNAAAVALSLTYPPGDPRIVGELRFLRQHLAEEITLIVGGQAAPSYQATLDEIGALYVDKINGIMDVLSKLRSGSAVSKMQ